MQTTNQHIQNEPQVMRITVLGATGNVGSRVVAEALSRGHEITAVVRDSSRVHELPAGVSARQGHADILRRTMGEQLGVDLSGYSNSQMLDSIEYHVFPNACIFPGISVPFVYRFRPLSIDTCIHEILVLILIYIYQLVFQN